MNISHLGTNRGLLSRGLPLGDADGLSSLGGGSGLLGPSLSTSICCRTLLGGGSDLWDSWEDSGARVA